MSPYIIRIVKSHHFILWSTYVNTHPDFLRWWRQEIVWNLATTILKRCEVSKLNFLSSVILGTILEKWLLGNKLRCIFCFVFSFSVNGLHHFTHVCFTSVSFFLLSLDFRIAGLSSKHTRWIPFSIFQDIASQFHYCWLILSTKPGVYNTMHISECKIGLTFLQVVSTFLVAE